MSLFQDLGTPTVPNRRTLFWLVCILIRLLLATSFTLLVLYGPEWASYVFGGVGIVVGLSFWYRKFQDDKDNIWWYRSVHGAIWLLGGIACIFVRSTQDASAAAGVTAAFFFSDVLFGVITALFFSRNPWDSTTELNPDRFVSFKGAGLCGYPDTEAYFFTPWTAMHVATTTMAGIASYFIDKHAFDGEYLWAVCLVASYGILLWEALENTRLDLKEWWFGQSKIDSVPNMFGDIVVGFACLWGTAFILKAAGA